MDRDTRSEGSLSIPFAVGAAAVSPLVLVSAISGLFLGVLLLPLFPIVAFGWLAAGRLAREPRPRAAVAARAAPAVPVTAGVTAAAPTAAAVPAVVLAGVVAADAALAPVFIRVSTARGTCPMGYRYKAGTEYVFRNGDVSPEFCPVARRALAPLVAQVRRGEIPTNLQPFCKTSVHEVVFEFGAGARAAPEVQRVLP